MQIKKCTCSPHARVIRKPWYLNFRRPKLRTVIIDYLTWTIDRKWENVILEDSKVRRVSGNLITLFCLQYIWWYWLQFGYGVCFSGWTLEMLTCYQYYAIHERGVRFFPYSSLCFSPICLCHEVNRFRSCSVFFKYIFFQSNSSYATWTYNSRYRR